MTDHPVRTERRGDALLVTIDNPPVNVISQSVRAGLLAAVAEAEAALASGAIGRVVLTGAGRAFVAGGLFVKRDGLPSAKPDAFYSILERLYPGPRTEIFSRRSRPGWQVATSDQPDRLDEVARIMRDVWPLREREERLAAARRRAR